MIRSGSADLPLHGGRVPAWLYERMARLAREIVGAIVLGKGPHELLRRLSDPFWFQAFGSVLGMDWHSSGITTSVMGALSQAINPACAELGLFVCGGRGRHSRNTPTQLWDWSEKTGLNGSELVTASRLTAKIDSSCVQDGFDIYLHSFVVTMDGAWTVVQQGMNDASGLARRYHWHSAHISSFLDDPHTAVIGKNCGNILNLADSRAAPARTDILDFLTTPVTSQIKELRHLVMERPHQITPALVNSKRLGAVLLAAHEEGYRDFSQFLLQEGVGPRTVQALALVSEVIYGEPTRFSDPARFAFAHGGKDGAPFPVPLTVYDESIETLKKAVDSSRLDRSDKLDAFKKLHQFVVNIEEEANPAANVNAVIREEWRRSPSYGGMTIQGAVKKGAAIPKEFIPPWGIQTELLL